MYEPDLYFLFSPNPLNEGIGTKKALIHIVLGNKLFFGEN